MYNGPTCPNREIWFTFASFPCIIIKYVAVFAFSHVTSKCHFPCTILDNRIMTNGSCCYIRYLSDNIPHTWMKCKYVIMSWHPFGNILLGLTWLFAYIMGERSIFVSQVYITNTIFGLQLHDILHDWYYYHCLVMLNQVLIVRSQSIKHLVICQ